MRVLIVDPDESAAASLAKKLDELAYAAETIPRASDALRRIIDEEFDVVLSVFGLPEMNAAELCRMIRREELAIPVLVLDTAFDVNREIECFDSGADDYITRSHEFEGIEARIRGVVRRCTHDEGDHVSYGDLTLDLTNRGSHFNGQPFALTRREFSLLEHLVRNRERVLSRTSIGEHVWGEDYHEETSNVVDVYISRLRRKLDHAGCSEDLIQTAHGTGYILSRETFAS